RKGRPSPLRSLRLRPRASLRRHAGKLRTPPRFAKYLAGGWLYFWSGYAVFAFCYSLLKWDWLPAKILADAVGWTLNYLVQRLWAFADRISLSEMQHAGRYVFIEAIGFVLDYLIIWGLKAVGISPYIGFFVSAGF